MARDSLCERMVLKLCHQVNGVGPDSKLLFMSDTKSFFSKNYGWDAGMGDRNGRWAMVIEKDGTVSVADNEASPREVKVSKSALRLHPVNGSR